jgi:hypothetical protein
MLNKKLPRTIAFALIIIFLVGGIIIQISKEKSSDTIKIGDLSALTGPFACGW